ncbi:MAG: adenylyltransferase/cytidyltransferase family protein, partial [Bacteroidota bacterium]|nr:adenylyltransferase/cytidyltransferase family protein [Bacteroidota bacterium]
MKIGLFFGSFNPMHIGHKVIASYMAEFSDLQQVWFVVSPQNPLKEKQILLNQSHRLMIIRTEVEDN